MKKLCSLWITTITSFSILKIKHRASDLQAHRPLSRCPTFAHQALNTWQYENKTQRRTNNKMLPPNTDFNTRSCSSFTTVSHYPKAPGAHDRLPAVGEKKATIQLTMLSHTFNTTAAVFFCRDMEWPIISSTVTVCTINVRPESEFCSLPPGGTFQ